MSVRLFSFFTLLVAVVGCSPIPPAPLPPPLIPQARSESQSVATVPNDGAQQSAFERMPAPPAVTPSGSRNSPPAQAMTPLKAEPAGGFQLNFNQVPLTTLIQVVYADMLGRTVQLDPKVAERRDLVSFRTPPGQTAAQVESATRLLLASFGLVPLDFGAMVRVVPAGAQSGELPELRRGAAQPETPVRMRPVFQLVDLESVRNVEVAGWLKTIIGTRVTVAEDPTRNALLLSGTSDNVTAAIEIIRMLDQPVMRGRSSLRVNPVYWSAGELAATLQQVLTAEGYAIPPPNQPLQPGGARYPIMLLPVPATNSLLVFAISDEVLRHIETWVSKLDQPSKQTAGKNFFTYTPRNVSADSLARTLGQVIEGGATTGAAPAGAIAAGAAGKANAPAASTTSVVNRMVVDSNTNTLIFNTNAENYSQLITLLKSLDQPSKSALIEVTVAEVRLTDDFQFGVEWLLKESGASSATVIGTLGGLGLGTTGLTLTRLASGGDVRLVLNALASSNRATILSSPRIVARNGETAHIQVGQEVPIITSQQSTLSGSTDTGTGVLQTVQYRNTGVILNIKPSIFSGDRVDLDVRQEVSAAQETSTGVNNSPTFLTRNVDTKLTLQNGSTVMLGGLIGDADTSGSTGVPWLMRLPIIGQLFRVDSQHKERTELIILITPYVINDDADAAHFTEAFKNMLPLLKPRFSPPPKSDYPEIIAPYGTPMWPSLSPLLTTEPPKAQP